jgi:hypothetical protein
MKLFAARGTFVTGFGQKSIRRNRVTGPVPQANIKQASETPPTIKTELNRKDNQ